MSLSSIASTIWGKLGSNDRANSATTIAVFELHSSDGDGAFRFCTSNDVSVISSDAKDEAEGHNIFGLDHNPVNQAGAGFHAEMWGVICAGRLQSAVDDAPDTPEMHIHYAALAPNAVLKSVGASRACCKYCTAVLDVLKIAYEQGSQDEYDSWINPLTTGDDGHPLPDFAKHQRKAIPDYRQHGINYWFKDTTGRALSKEPLGA